MAHQAGGRTRVTINGQTYSCRTAPNIRPARMQNQSYTNHDGSVTFGTMPQPAAAEFSFDVGPAGVDKFNETLMMGFHAITILEVDRGVLHQFTNARIIGEPSINTETGEVSGLSIQTDSYLRTRA